jgi:hypothetical protein
MFFDSLSRMIYACVDAHPREIAVGRTQEFIAQTCFILSFFLGVYLLAHGLVIDRLLPHVQLDAVLDPAELLDARKRDEMLRVLAKANMNYAPIWVCSGLIAVCTSVAGLVAMNWSRMRRTRRV